MYYTLWWNGCGTGIQEGLVECGSATSNYNNASLARSPVKLSRLSPLEPFAIHVRDLPTNVRFKGTFEYGCPVKVTLVFRHFLLWFLYSVSVVRCGRIVACNTFAFDESRPKVWEIPRRVKRFPPTNSQRERKALEASNSPEVVEVI